MRHPKAPSEVQSWINSPPVWVKIQKPKHECQPQLRGLGDGELEAIAIAIEENADAVLMDDRAGIREGRMSNLTVLTTFSVLELGAIRNLIDFEETLEQLAQTNFRMPPVDVLNEYLQRSAERKSTQ